MPGPVIAGLALALCASVAQSAGFLFQHIRAAERASVNPLHPVAALAAMLRSKWWLIGLALGIGGFALHLVAIALAPLSLVQAFVAGGLALAVPVAAIGFHHRLLPLERRAVIAMAIALALLPIGVAHSGNHFGFDPGRLAIYLGGVAAVALLGVATLDERRYAALGLAAGAFYGILDSSLKALTDLLHRHDLATALRSPWIIVAITSLVAAFFCFQRALQTNRALTAIGLMEAAADSTAILAGFVAFGDSLGSSAPLAAIHAVAFTTVGFAAFTLARAQRRLTSDDDDDAIGTDPEVHDRSAPRQPVAGVG